MDRTLVLTYGTPKRGFSNHGLIQQMIRSGDAAFVGVVRTAGRLLLFCGPYRVPFLLNLPGAGDRVRGELYAVSPSPPELRGGSVEEKRGAGVRVVLGGGGKGVRIFVALLPKNRLDLSLRLP